MTRYSWRSLRTILLAVALAALVIDGLRELPVSLECYQFWQGVARAERDVELIAGASGLDSEAGRRALLNARQSREQAWASCHDRLFSLVDVTGGAAAGLLLLGLILRGPVASVRGILRRFACRHRKVPEITP